MIPPRNPIEKAQLKLLFSEAQIQVKVKEIARHLSHFYAKEELMVAMVLKGSLCFVSDLIRHLEIPITLECIKASSYGLRGHTPGDLKIEMDSHIFENKAVLLVDDIFDSGTTLHHIKQSIAKQNPRSIQTVVLLSKEVPRDPHYEPPNYTLFTVPQGFVVGYGLDYKEHYRGLSALYLLELP